MKIIAVIPARFASTRFPGKPLAMLKGRPIIEWVVRRARDVSAIKEIYVATDHDDIAVAAENAGAGVLMPEGDFVSGTDRIAAAVKNIDADIIVNIQGDEPQINRETIKRALAAVTSDHITHVGTACVKIKNDEQFNSPDVVKVVRDRYDFALYFSRSPIPSLSRVEGHGLQNFEISPDNDNSDQIFYGWKHIGIYAYRRSVLEEFVSLSPSFLETTEKLEQLRLMENGYKIKVAETPFDSLGIDTPDDLATAEKSFSE